MAKRKGKKGKTTVQSASIAGIRFSLFIPENVLKTKYDTRVFQCSL